MRLDYKTRSRFPYSFIIIFSSFISYERKLNSSFKLKHLCWTVFEEQTTLQIKIISVSEVDLLRMPQVKTEPKTIFFWKQRRTMEKRLVIFIKQRKLKKHEFHFLQAWKTSKNMNFIFLKFLCLVIFISCFMLILRILIPAFMYKSKRTQIKLSELYISSCVYEIFCQKGCRMEV